MESKKILLVEDSRIIQLLIQTVLCDYGYELKFVSNGQEALAELNKQKPDLLILDIMMPVMDGYETIRRIRKMEEFTKLPIIAVTAKAMKKDYDDCIAAGASDYLPKPVDIHRLLSVMRVWLYR